MGYLMTAAEFVRRAKSIADNYKTTYVWGSFGLPCTAANLQRMINQYPSNSKYKTAVNALLGTGWMFDCIGLIKGILWGWVGDKSKTYGGGAYASNGVPDLNDTAAIGICSGVSSDFSGIVPGEVVWMSGHIGIYIGGGLVIECTPAWRSGVQYSACLNIGAKSGYNSRRWTKHGKLPYIDYGAATTAQTGSALSCDGKGKRALTVIVKTFLNVRRYPHAESAVLAALHNGDSVEWHGYSIGEWYYIRTAAGLEGYVASKYLA